MAESLAIKRHLRQRHDLPYMAIETDYSTADLGQLSTASPPLSKCCGAGVNYTVGIDSGSTAKRHPVGGRVIVRRFLCHPFRLRRRHPRGLGDTARWPTETPFLTLTGYGRQLDFADKQVTEISCHGLGARLLARTPAR